VCWILSQRFSSSVTQSTMRVFARSSTPTRQPPSTSGWSKRATTRPVWRCDAPRAPTLFREFSRIWRSTTFTCTTTLTTIPLWKTQRRAPRTMQRQRTQSCTIRSSMRTTPTPTPSCGSRDVRSTRTRSKSPVSATTICTRWRPTARRC
jgi:hypothetical protein